MGTYLWRYIVKFRTLGVARSYIHTDMKKASSITAQILVQLVKLAGLRVIGVANLQKHRELLESLGTGA
jgi:plasmid maintenance system antidote protein VapI